jgi:HK97 family phage major capsid protein
MAESSGATGGYTVPTEYSNVLFQTIAENSIFWPRANIVPMGSVETVLPVPDFSTAQAAGTTAMFGGLLYQFGQGAAGNEGTAITETEPAFRQLSLHAWDLIGQAVASVQWVEDLMAREDGEERLLNLFGQAAAYYADYYFFNGTGAARKTPLGVLNAPCKIAVARSGAGHVTAADVAGMAKRLLPGCWRTAIWCVSPYTLIDLFQITAFQPNQNTVGMPSGCCGSLYSRPVFVTEKLPTLGTTGDIVLMDPALYVIGDRQQPEVAASKDEPSTFVYNQMMFRTWMRCDGKPLLPAAVTLMDGSSTASSVVVLAT